MTVSVAKVGNSLVKSLELSMVILLKLPLTVLKFSKSIIKTVLKSLKLSVEFLALRPYVVARGKAILVVEIAISASSTCPRHGAQTHLIDMVRLVEW